MSGSLKLFANRCRCCLEKFYEGEKISIITSFFGFQFRAFTQLEVSYQLVAHSRMFLISFFLEA